eukprot:GHVU01127419.1.p2 GENE.GHVU01127419.1~~GHVU01127419.1.p2  ORF type:complete len:448 (-),score=73.36 GHVU01127419.1:2943-4286(-)
MSDPSVLPSTLQSSSSTVATTTGDSTASKKLKSLGSFDSETSLDAAIKAITWKDVSVAEKNPLTGSELVMIWGQDARIFAGKKIRTMSSALSVTGQKNHDKDGMIDRLRETWKAIQQLDDDATLVAGTRKGKHCGYRLINILYLNDSFRMELLRWGKPATRDELQSGTAVVDMQFWATVCEEYKQATEEYGKLHFDHPAYAERAINPGNEIIPHSAEKLRGIFDSVVTQWRNAKAASTKTGTNNPDFYRYCKNNPEVLYFNEFSQQYGEVGEALAAELPQGARCNSTNDSWAGGQSSYDSRGRKRKADSDVGDGMRTLAASLGGEAFASQKAACLAAANDRSERKIAFEATAAAAATAHSKAAAEETLYRRWKDVSQEIRNLEAIPEASLTPSMRTAKEKLTTMKEQLEEDLGLGGRTYGGGIIPGGIAQGAGASSQQSQLQARGVP